MRSGCIGYSGDRIGAVFGRRAAGAEAVFGFAGASKRVSGRNKEESSESNYPVILYIYIYPSTQIPGQKNKNSIMNQQYTVIQTSDKG